MHGGVFLFPLYVDPAEAVAADAPEVLHPVPAPAAPATSSDVFDPQRLAALLRAASMRSNSRGSSVEATEIDADTFNLLPVWAQAVVQTGCFNASQESKGIEGHSHRSPAVANKLKRAVQLQDDEVGNQEQSPRKRRKKRPLPGSTDADDVEPSSPKDEVSELQECLDGLNAEEDMEVEGDCEPHAVLTQAERVADSIEKYSSKLERLLDKATHRQQLENFRRDDLDVFASADIKMLLRTLKIMEKSDLVQKLAPELLIGLMGALDTQVRLGLAMDVLSVITPQSSEDGGKQQPQIDDRLVFRLQLSVDAGICQLIVMTTPQIDRRVLSEENIDNCIQLLNHLIRHLLLPCIDTTYVTTASTATEKGAAAPQKPPETPESPDTPRSKRRSTRSKNSGYSRVNLRVHKNVRKAIDRVIPVVCEFMEQLARLVQGVKLADRWVLHFSTSMVELFALDHSSYATSLQQSALSVLRSIFLEYKPHRVLVLEEIVGVMIKLPTTKRTLRTVKLLNSSDSIQRVSTLVVSMVQSCASAQKLAVSEAGSAQNSASEPHTTPHGTNGEVASQKDKAAAIGLEETRGSARDFVRALMRECLTKKGERDNRVVLENFVDDLLVMFVRPEWAGAEDLLEALSSSLASILNAYVTKDAKKLESQFSLSALNLVGRICTSIKRYQNKVERDVLEDDDDSFAIVDEHTRLMRETLLGVKDDNAMGEKEDASPQAFQRMALKHIVTMHLLRSGSNQSDSKRLLLLKFIAAAGSQWDAADTTRIELERKLWVSLWGTSKGDISLSSKVAAPTNELGMRSNLHLVIEREFCGHFDKLLVHVMALLSKGMPTFRARVMKVLGEIVDVDPMLMAEGGVQTAVERCFLDERTSVRQATVDLVGKYVTLQPVLFSRYFDALSERLRDKGVSVRKSVCKIFRVFLAQSSAKAEMSDSNTESRLEEELHRKSACMRSLVERIGDTSESQVVKNFIIDTFQEVWFGSEFSSCQLSSARDEGFADGGGLPPGWVAVAAVPDTKGPSLRSGETSEPVTEFVSPDGRVVQSVEEAWATYRTPEVAPASVVKSKQAKLDDTPEIITTIVEVIHDMVGLNWFVELLKRLMEERTEKDSKAGGRVIKDRSGEAEVAQARSKKIVAGLVNCIMDLQEGKPLQGVSIGDTQVQFLACMKALSAFCEARPSLLSHHLETIRVYLKDEDVKIQALAVSIVSSILRLGRVPERVAKLLEADLNYLVFKSPPSVVGPSIKCLAALASVRRRAPVLLFRMLEKFYVYLLKHKQTKSLAGLSNQESSSLQRALFTSGLIAGATDMDTCEKLVDDAKVLKIGSVMQSLYDIYTKFIRLPGNTLCAAKAVQGMGFLFPIRPRLFFQAQQERLLDFLLTNAPDVLKLQCLTSLKELLNSEEQRLENGVATRKTDRSKSKEQQVRGDQEADASLIGSVMQAELSSLLVLSLWPSARVRVEAVACMSALLTQGLVSPLQCIPNLVALETDQVVGNRDAAHAQLVALSDKFPGLLHTPSIQGIMNSYPFQLNVFGSSTVLALDKDKKEFCLLGRLYTDCLRPVRTQRNLFLKALVNQFMDSGSILQVSKVKPVQAAATERSLKYLSYLAQLILALPYDVEDEPLYIIYLINRYASLRLGSVLDDLKKLFADAGVAPELMEEDEADLTVVDDSELCSAGRLSRGKLTSLESNGRLALALALLLRLKFALKHTYALESERCATYQPAKMTNDTNTPVERTHKQRAKLPAVDELFQEHKDPVPLNWHMFLLAWQAAREDQHQLDLDVQQDERARPVVRRRSRRRRTRQQPQDDDDDYVGGLP